VVSSTERILPTVDPGRYQVTSKLDSSLGGVEADPGQIQQILMNLVVNAATPYRGSGQAHHRNANAKSTPRLPFTAVASFAGSYVMLSVADPGSGWTRHAMVTF